MEDEALKKEESLAQRKDSLKKQEASKELESGNDGGEIVLKPKMTLINGITVIVGSIIGSGIFVSPTGVLINTGSVNMSLIVWVISGLFSMVSYRANEHCRTAFCNEQNEHLLRQPVPAKRWSDVWP